MYEKHEYIPSKADSAEAERQLSPEQATASRARYEIKKHQEILESVGLTREQVDEAATLASDEAVKTYHELEQVEPWKHTMNIVNNPVPRAQGVRGQRVGVG